MPNHLAGSTSPYLLQHAANPVDWYPWGPEALSLARAEDRPILLSIGYAACHWCHVMAHESFEDAETARFINEHFVAIKVDREERPDLDAIYMKAVQAITGSGGWPMTVFLTPDARPYYGGTYFPPKDMHGLPSFGRVLRAASEAYGSRRGEVLHAVDQITAALSPAAASAADLSQQVLDGAAAGLEQLYDAQDGGFGDAPKFPQSMALEFLLSRNLPLVEHSLEAMARGGIHDQLGGGFHRYSVDPRWRVPHFEKMLYDNALLARLYLHTFQASGRPIYRRIAEQTLDYVLRDLAGPFGGFYSAQDADSEGVEGKFYTWQWQDLSAVGLADYFGATRAGVVDGANVLHLPEGPLDEVSDAVIAGKRQLLATRQERVRPRTDQKILAGWNGLMLRSLAEAGAALGREDYLAAATRSAGWLLASLRREDGRLLRSVGAAVPAFLEDHAALGLSLLSLYETTGDPRWLRESISLAAAAVRLFWDEPAGLFYDTGSDADALIVRPRELADNALPSGNSLACELLLRLGSLLGDQGYRTRAERVLTGVLGYVTRFPLGFGHMLGNAAFAASDPVEIAIVGAPVDPATQTLLSVAHRPYLPNRVLAVGLPESALEVPSLPLLAGRQLLGGLPTAYVCRERSCLPPVTDDAELSTLLASLAPVGGA